MEIIFIIVFLFLLFRALQSTGKKHSTDEVENIPKEEGKMIDDDNANNHKVKLSEEDIKKLKFEAKILIEDCNDINYLPDIDFKETQYKYDKYCKNIDRLNEINNIIKIDNLIGSLKYNNTEEFALELLSLYFDSIKTHISVEFDEYHDYKKNLEDDLRDYDKLTNGILNAKQSNIYAKINDEDLDYTIYRIEQKLEFYKRYIDTAKNEKEQNDALNNIGIKIVDCSMSEHNEVYENILENYYAYYGFEDDDINGIHNFIDKIRQSKLPAESIQLFNKHIEEFGYPVSCDFDDVGFRRVDARNFVDSEVLSKVDEVLNEALDDDYLDYTISMIKGSIFNDTVKEKIEKLCDSITGKNNSVGSFIKIDKMEGIDFEKWCANLLKLLNYKNVTITPASGDQGVDILAEKDEITYAIQCKRYEEVLGNKPIQEVSAGRDIYECDIAVVMTNSCFTDSAKQQARKLKVKLWDRKKLSQMIEQAQKNA